MKTFSSYGVAMALLIGFVIISCSDDDEASIVPPEVVSISPSEGPKTTIVIVNGSNFSSAVAENEVTFNGKPAIITAATATQLTVSVPAAADSGPIIVKTKGQAATNQPLFKFQWLVNTVAGSSMGYIDGLAAKFNSPSGIAADAAGNTYVTDFGNNVIRKITPAGEVSTVAGSDAGYFDGPAKTAKFFFPNGSAVDQQGNIYISEEGTSRIRKISPAGAVTTFAGSGTFSFGDGAGTAAHFYQPSGIAVDLQGNVFVADQFNHKIRKITPSGVVTTLAGSTSGSADGTGSAAQFYRPTGVVADGKGNVFVADLFNHKIRKITATGIVTTIAGSTPGFADGPAATAKFAFPAGLALDKQGNLYVADSENHRIRKITPAGEVTTFAGTGVQGINDGTAAGSQFSIPREIDVDAEGNVYVVDAASHRVRKID
jgi:sugar lactone lactonase YvrE